MIFFFVINPRKIQQTLSKLSQTNCIHFTYGKDSQSNSPVDNAMKYTPDMLVWPRSKNKKREVSPSSRLAKGWAIGTIYVKYKFRGTAALNSLSKVHCMKGVFINPGYWKVLLQQFKKLWSSVSWNNELMKSSIFFYYRIRWVLIVIVLLWVVNPKERYVAYSIQWIEHLFA